MQVTLLGAPEVTDSPSALVKLTEVHPPCAPLLFQERGLVPDKGCGFFAGFSHWPTKNDPLTRASSFENLGALLQLSNPSSWIEEVDQMIRGQR